MTDNVVHLFKDPPPDTERVPALVVPLPLEAAETRPERVWRRTGRAVVKAARDERTRSAGRAVVRHGSYVVGGTRIVARRAWDGRTAARYERMIRAAEAAGNLEVAAEWEERGRQYRAARHQRRMDLLTSPERLVKNAAYATGGTLAGLLLLGIALAVATKEPGDVLTPLMALVELCRLVVVIATVVWGPLVTLGPWLALCGLWAVGRHQQAAPQWALPTQQRTSDAGAPITPSIVVTALRDLGIAPLRKAIKEMGDAGAAMLGPIRIAGCGVEVDVTLPSGVSTQEVQGRRRKLAENLSRHEHEAFITIPTAARTVRLWIADSGALDEPIGPSPLVLDAELRADYKKGKAPWGQDLRGDAAALSLYQRHMLVTGVSNQGKTAAVRALALWLALDPNVEFRIADLKGIGDWAMFDGIATVLIQGPTDDHVIQATEMVESGVTEMERRLTSPPGTTFPPLIVLVDEAQLAFMCPVKDEEGRPYGGSKATSRYFMAARKIHNQGRAVNVLLWQGTQDPTDQNLPKLVREGAHTRASLALGTESQARMALGDKAVDGGAAPHLLRQGLDKGTLVVASDGIAIPAGQASITVRTHYIDDDQAAETAARARALRDGVTTLTVIDTDEPTDPLADIAAVIGTTPRVLTQDVLQRLATTNPKAYGSWTNGDLKRVLEDAGAEPYKSDGRMVVSRDRVARALANRDDEGSASAAQ
ncbi:FtsK/SpoIIIE domain-containing protein [Streptomyces roseolilacinus]|uniref:Cell division protein FtsK n=1 Tax=Streptomyces roseolilacinus TaxID=66904 RepID=A0A918EKA7_9ACTN|nr:FtsK/SpoIIIE domain-containing protein [Streptomyces roseolilacinus]GGQ12535.1 cell division protein FtsK [Streptomyces roseolilacinus]